EAVAMALHRTTKVQVGEHLIDFKRPWKRYTMYEAIEHFTGTDISGMEEAEMADFAKKMGVEVDATMGKGKLIDEIFGETCEASLIQPTFIYDYPLETSPLTKKHRSKPGLTERFEAVCNGKEICNAYSELNDPIDQRKRFEDQLELGKRGDTESMVLDEDFLRALEIGMPPTAGLGIGIDRLSMIMTNAPSIQDVLFFPQMRPEKKSEASTDQEFVSVGVPEAWIPALKKLNIMTLEALKAANPNKLLNDLGGMRKKLKMEIPAVQLDEIKVWIEKI
ncbi:MAG: amino acid--tRNA ligase-related protein, partial [Bacteroidales bacterium]